jgi:hypothetical protein
MNESLVKYLAGLLDADGSVSFRFRRDDNKPHRHYIGLNLSLASSAAVDVRGFVKTLPDITGLGTFSVYGSDGQFYKWEINRSAHIEMLLPRLIKHSVVKGQHWKWMLETWRNLRSKACSEDECNVLRLDSKVSRATRIGPVHPKNHPTWAWLAGYLDGDGCYRFHPISGKKCMFMQVNAVAHVNDAAVLHFLEKSFGGTVGPSGPLHPNVVIWRRGLGSSHRSFALRFLPQVVRHARLKKHKIEQMIHHHQQRLSAPSPTG